MYICVYIYIYICVYIYIYYVMYTYIMYIMYIMHITSYPTQGLRASARFRKPVGGGPSSKSSVSLGWYSWTTAGHVARVTCCVVPV